MNRLLTTEPKRLVRGVVTASGGNHGLAVARAATMAGVAATIFVPESTASYKLAKLDAWAAKVVRLSGQWDAARDAALAFASGHGAEFIHPFADPMVVAGQGTIGLEIIADLPDVDVLIVAIGGGGLIGGISVALRALRPNVRIIGVEPVGSPTLRACLDAGRLVKLDRIATRVATMACPQTEEPVFQIVRQNVRRHRFGQRRRHAGGALALVRARHRGRSERRSGARCAEGGWVDRSRIGQGLRAGLRIRNGGVYGARPRNI